MSKKNQFKQANVLPRKPISTSNEEVEYVEIIDSDIVVFNPFHPNNQDLYEEFVSVISKIVTEGKNESGEVSFSGMQILKLLFPVLTNANFNDYTDEELEFVVDNVDMYLDIVEAKDLVMDYCVRFLNHLERFSKLPNAAKKYYMQQGQKTTKEKQEEEKVEVVEEVIESEEETEEIVLPNTQYVVEDGAVKEITEDAVEAVEEAPEVVSGAIPPMEEVVKSDEDELDEIQKQIFKLLEKRNELKKRIDG